MSMADTRARRDELIRQFGPWTNYNVDLGEGVFTIGQGADGVAERRVSRIVRAVEDASCKPLSELRVLDLGCYEGAFGIALAQRGASVLGLEAREEHVAKARFAGEVLGLERLEIRQADMRELSLEEHGEFDVVLCLGVLYHLDAPDCFELAGRVADVCSELAIIETQVSLSRPRRETWRGHEYAGRSYPENVAHPGASKDNPESFWPTRPSLLNVLGDVGFTSITELLSPVIPSLAAFRDHVTLLAWKGAGSSSSERWPESLGTVAHPTQGLRYRLLERFARLRGDGIPSIFSKRVGSR
jgi:SAM-dependent methyltransferase